MRVWIQIIVIFASVVLFSATNWANHQGEMLPTLYPSSPNYCLVTSMSAEFDSLETTYFIARWTDKPLRTTYMIMDSVRAVYAEAIDTNHFLFICADIKSYHLVLASISSAVNLDTVMTQGIRPPENWLAYPSEILIVPSSHIVAGTFGNRKDSANFEIRLLKSDGTTLLLHSICNVVKMSSSVDRSELYFLVESFQSDRRYTHVRIYDVAADSFYVVGDSNNSVSWPFRNTTASALYYASQRRSNFDIWRMMPDGKHEKVFRFKQSETIEYFVEGIDSLELVIRDFMIDSTYSVYFAY